MKTIKAMLMVLFSVLICTGGCCFFLWISALVLGLDWDRQTWNWLAEPWQIQRLADGTEVRVIPWQRHTPEENWQSVPVEAIRTLINRGLKLNSSSSFFVAGQQGGTFPDKLVMLTSGSLVVTYVTDRDALRDTYRVLVRKHRGHGWDPNKQKLVPPDEAKTDKNKKE